MLEITGADVKELSDKDLRSLIGLLCEAELLAARLSTAGITWGGHHNAKDGGVDVRVELSSPLQSDNYIPRARIGFQVKKPDMPPAKILDEMRPNGKLREVINDLAASGGAYIIVSSQGSTSDLALMNRKGAMQEALSDNPNADKIKLDFYDRDRVAAWVRSHPSLILWVRDKIGRPVQGWRPFENWSNPAADSEEEYLLDGHIRLFNSSTRLSEGFTAVDGMNELRVILNKPRSAVRLVGLSGVGKTRLLQALFDERIGENPLDKTNVFYCDIANRPVPDPQSFAAQLVAFRRPSLLAIDNCPPSLHKILASLCSASDSRVSLITIEYDVREDQPEETEVFRLEPASCELIEKVIECRFPHITPVSARIVANFSGGNARIAIALCKTITLGEDVSHLKDEELFTRLFLQRNEPNHDLLNAVEVCSLVYSFNCQISQCPDNELKILSSLIGIDVLKLYQHVSELQRRELVQQRGMWRAVLPHAIANRLAKRALENIPIEYILDTFENNASERLIKSFSRRLSYLHESEVAKEISRRWLTEEGLMGDVSNLNSLGISILINIAPTNPEATLLAIERVASNENAALFFSRENSHFLEIVKILRSIAYDKELFIRSTDLICRFALSEKPNENQNSIRKLLKSLFYIKLSGTHATADQRLSITEKLLNSKEEEKIELGLTLLAASLQAWHFSSSYEFEFGAHSRDYGYFPKTKEEVIQWFKLFIDYTVKIGISDLQYSYKARDLLAEKFRELWVNAGMFEDLFTASINISKKLVWKEGWIAVKSIIRYDGKEMSAEVIERLVILSEILVPTTLIERARMYALSKGHPYDLIDTMEDEEETSEKNYETIYKITRSLGKEVCSNDEILIELLPEILSQHGNRLFDFGQGLAEGSGNPVNTWGLFKLNLLQIDETKRNYQAVRGFLNVLSHKNVGLCDDLLDAAVYDSVWGIAFPLLQASVDINSKGVERLKQSLVVKKAPIWYYSHLAYERTLEKISDIELSELLTIISNTEGGLAVSIEIFCIRIHGLSSNELSDIIKKTGQELLSRYLFSLESNNTQDLDYKLSKIIKICYADKSSKDQAQILCARLVDRFVNQDIIYSMDYDDVLVAIASTQPIVFMDTFLNREIQKDIHWLFYSHTGSKNPMESIKDEIILKWCDEEPEIRYESAASLIISFKSNEDHKRVGWTKLAEQFIFRAPDPIKVLNNFKVSFTPTIWSGSLADILQTRVSLISELKSHKNVIVAGWAAQEEINIEKEIRTIRERELRRASESNETFE